MTLIELMVVVTILAILTTGVGLSAGGLFSRPGGVSAAERLEQADRRARDLALLSRGVTGLYPRESGWVLARQDVAGQWLPEGAPLRIAGASILWSVDGARYLPRVADPAPGDAPPIQIAADGGSTPFALDLVIRGESLRCTAGLGGSLRCGR